MRQRQNCQIGMVAPSFHFEAAGDVILLVAVGDFGRQGRHVVADVAFSHGATHIGQSVGPEPRALWEVPAAEVVGLGKALKALHFRVRVDGALRASHPGVVLAVLASQIGA
jgi:hypothetical protein